MHQFHLWILALLQANFKLTQIWQVVRNIIVASRFCILFHIAPASIHLTSGRSWNVMQVKVTEDIRLDGLGRFLLKMIDKYPKGPIGRATYTTCPRSCPICQLTVDGDDYFMCVCCLSPIHERCSMKCPCVESHLWNDWLPAIPSRRQLSSRWNWLE